MSPEDEAAVESFMPLAQLWLSRCEQSERSLATMFVFIDASARRDELEKLQAVKAAFKRAAGEVAH